MNEIYTFNTYDRYDLVFAAFYFVTVQRVGFEYEDAILIPSRENGSTVYSGKCRGQQARFTVSEEKNVVFQCGSQTYGPYTAKEDPTAIPQDAETAEAMTGVELRQGEDVLFRGGVRRNRDYYLLLNEDGTLDNIRFSYVTSDGLERDENGNVIDPMEPSDWEIAGRYISWTILAVMALVIFVMGLR